MKAGTLLVGVTLLSPKLLTNLGKTSHSLNILFIKLFETLLKVGKQLYILKNNIFQLRIYAA
jgi:hypothetical protein